MNWSASASLTLTRDSTSRSRMRNVSNWLRNSRRKRSTVMPSRASWRCSSSSETLFCCATDCSA